MATYAARLDVDVHTRAGDLPATLTVPPSPQGLVLFATVRGARDGARHLAEAEALRDGELATLRFDLLPEEDAAALDGAAVAADDGLLAEQLLAVTNWAARLYPGLPLGFLAEGEAVAAALEAAAELPRRVRAVVCAGGWPDLAGPALSRVQAATLLLTSAVDLAARASHREAQRRLRGYCELLVLPGSWCDPAAGLDQLGSLASREAVAWLVRHLTSQGERELLATSSTERAGMLAGPLR